MIYAAWDSSLQVERKDDLNSPCRSRPSGSAAWVSGGLRDLVQDAMPEGRSRLRRHRTFRPVVGSGR
jgi:hypothetical protein